MPRQSYTEVKELHNFYTFYPLRMTPVMSVSPLTSTHSSHNQGISTGKGIRDCKQG